MMQLPDYVLGEVLYEGPETRVRRAIYLPTGERLVIKLPTSDTPSLRTIGRLIHEHQILSKLAHVAGVSRPHTLEQQSGSVALVLKDAGLRALDRVLTERGRLPVEASLRIALSLCRVLEGVHAAGVMHKDIKPHDIVGWHSLREEGCQAGFADGWRTALMRHLEGSEQSMDGHRFVLVYCRPVIGCFDIVQ